MHERDDDLAKHILGQLTISVSGTGEHVLITQLADECVAVVSVPSGQMYYVIESAACQDGIRPPMS